MFPIIAEGSVLKLSDICSDILVGDSSIGKDGASYRLLCDFVSVDILCSNLEFGRNLAQWMVVGEE